MLKRLKIASLELFEIPVNILAWILWVLLDSRSLWDIYSKHKKQTYEEYTKNR